MIIYIYIYIFDYNQGTWFRCHVSLAFYSNCIHLLLRGQPFGDGLWIIFRPRFWPSIFWTCRLASTSHCPCLSEPVRKPSSLVLLWPSLPFSVFKHSTPSWRPPRKFYINSYLLLLSLAGIYTPRHSVLKGRGNFHVLFFRDWKPLYIYEQLLIMKTCSVVHRSLLL